MTMENPTMFAKGRGFTRPSGLKKPGSNGSQKFDSVVDELSDKISCMEVTSDNVDELKSSLADICGTEETLRVAVDRLFNAARKNRQLCRSLGVVFGHYQNLSAEKSILRTVVLSRAQKDFTDRLKIKEESESEAINCAVLLCEIFRHTRVANKEPITALAGPVCSCMDDLFCPTASEESIIEGAWQLIQNGKDIETCNSEKAKELFCTIKVMMIAKPLSTVARCHLMYALECYLRRWQPIDDLFVYRDNGLKSTPPPGPVTKETPTPTHSLPPSSYTPPQVVPPETNSAYRTSPPSSAEVQDQKPKYVMSYTDVRKLLAQQEQSGSPRPGGDWRAQSYRDQRYENHTPQEQQQPRGRPLFKGRGYTNNPPLPRPGRQQSEENSRSVDQAWGGGGGRRHWYQHDDRAEEEENTNEGRGPPRGSSRDSWRENRGDSERGSWRDKRDGGNRGSQFQEKDAYNCPLPDDSNETW